MLLALNRYEKLFIGLLHLYSIGSYRKFNQY